MAATTEPTPAQGAQILLDGFTIPHFPPTARGLKALTLISSTPADKYDEELSKPVEIPDSIPSAIESLTLEQFGLGYPLGFLPGLAERLPNLKSLVLYSQLFSGRSDGSKHQAVNFFKQLPFLRAIHFLDVFAKPGFFEAASPWLKYNTSDRPGEARRGLMFLEVSYTYIQTDDSYMNRIAASELPMLVGPGLITCEFNISPLQPEEGQSADPAAQGVMAFNTSIAKSLVKVLVDEETYPRGLQALNTTLYTMTLDDFDSILSRHKNVVVLSTTIEANPGTGFRQKVLSSLEKCLLLEQVEIVIQPTVQFFMEVGMLACSSSVQADRRCPVDEGQVHGIC